MNALIAQLQKAEPKLATLLSKKYLKKRQYPFRSPYNPQLRKFHDPQCNMLKDHFTRRMTTVVDFYQKIDSGHDDLNDLPDYHAGHLGMFKLVGNPSSHKYFEWTPSWDVDVHFDIAPLGLMRNCDCQINLPQMSSCSLPKPALRLYISTTSLFSYVSNISRVADILLFI